MLRLRLRNVGLVRDAKIDLAALTVVMGPNNSGKSTLATTAYAALKTASALQERRYGGALLSNSARRIANSSVSRSTLANIRDNLKQQTAKGSGPVELKRAVQPHIDELVRGFLEQYGAAFVAELEAGLGAPLTELASRISGGRRQPLKISIESTDPSWSLDVWLRGDQAHYKAHVPEEFDFDEILGGQHFISLRVNKDVTLGDAASFISYLSEDIASNLFSSFPSGAHYLPAARAGLLQGHRLVAAAMFQRTPLVGLREMQMPALSGVVADFISEILLGEPRQQHRNRRSRQSLGDRVASEIEESVLDGQVRQIQITTASGYPEIEFEDELGRYPIHRASSMVSELAPVVLLLRRVVESGDILIIEEPESHLHPDTQLKLARILFRATARGLPIFVTTHSDFFLSQINAEIRATEIDRGLPRPASVAAYWVERDKTGSHIHPLPIDRLDGISEEAFTKIAADLYEEQVEQQLKLTD